MYVIDMLQVKRIEHRIGRRLTKAEIEPARYGEAIYVSYGYGYCVREYLHIYKFPQGLTRHLAEPTFNTEFFDYAFNRGVLKKVSHE